MRMSRHLAARLLCGVALCAAPAAALAASIHVVYNFNGPDGALPFSTLTPDGYGNFYGTTQAGGAIPCRELDGCGTIFKLDSKGSLQSLHSFDGTSEGGLPETGVSLIGGRLYGNTPGGPPGATSVLYSMGTDGSNFTVLHTMTGAQGTELVGQLQPAAGGGMFGLGIKGGRYGYGTLFYLGADGTFTVVHQFAGGSDGAAPTYLVEDATGNLYGSTSKGGVCAASSHGCGVVFKYAPATRIYSILYNFTAGTDGASPLVGAVATNGTVYGVSTQGGADHHGALFTLAPTVSGGYDFTVLTPIISRYLADNPMNPPALSPDGAVIGSTVYEGEYVYQNGVYTINYGDAYSYGQFVVPGSHSGVVLGMSEQSGTSSTCPLTYGCGYIFYATQ